MSEPMPILDSQSQTQEHTLDDSRPDDALEDEEDNLEEPSTIDIDQDPEGEDPVNDEEEEDDDAGEDGQSLAETARVQDKTTPKKRQRKAPAAVEREPGKSFFPVSRVQKIIKADKDLPMIAKEATFLISIAAEEFLKRFTQAAHRVAEREKRMTVQARDVDEFTFLNDICGYASLGDVSKPKRQPKGASAPGGNAMMDRFIIQPSAIVEEEGDDTGDVIMNEDGTMGVGGITLEDMNDASES
ncbi:hypothetical protein HWV62_9803 [Athelia sp. TMB]|nr:hypothetical protein HWV62_9803 [Athelia sp. TMB]